MSEDVWARWLLQDRFGADPELRRLMYQENRRWRRRVLSGAKVKLGDVVLDVGTGDGLIGIGALGLVGSDGRVIFSDISETMLQECRSATAVLNISAQCEFLCTSADDLRELDDCSIDVVTIASALMYVKDKRGAFAEFFRVLRPGGRLCCFEAVNSLLYPGPVNELAGYDASAIQELVLKIRALLESQRPADDPMYDFDDRSLFDLAAETGFTEIELKLSRQIRRERVMCSWLGFLSCAPNPLVGTRGEMFAKALSVEEQATLESELRPIVEAGERTRRLAVVSLTATKVS